MAFSQEEDLDKELKRQWYDLQKEEPPKKERDAPPTSEELEQLRQHKARVKAFLKSLTPEQRARLDPKKDKNKRAQQTSMDKWITKKKCPSESDGEVETRSMAATFKPSASSNLATRNDLAESLASKLGARPEYLTEDGASWIILVKGWMPTTDDDTFSTQWLLHPTTFHKLQLFGKTFHERRWSQAWGYNYAYSGTVSRGRELRTDDKESQMVRHLIDRANELVSGIIENGHDRPYNGCLQNWYEPDHTIGAHSDDEKDLRDGYPIFSLTWGGTRRFLFKARADSPSPCINKKRDLFLEDGDLLVMGGTCQKSHKHEVPKRRTTMDPPTSFRINWTIRAFLAEEKKNLKAKSRLQQSTS